ncbi:MAG: DUF4392 domain-containing protein [SAR202 cluster bacterium]|nr:DUF4392 domain-containing protein [SAR202 cluster bacterium]
MTTIEDIVLSNDRRGITALRPHLPPDFCDQAAKLILDNPGTAIIVTGFYILTAKAPETDGPPGAIVIGKALQGLGYKVVYVTDRYTAAVMSGSAGKGAEVVNFPITGVEESKAFAKQTLAKYKPSVLIAIERCGLTDEGKYRNMRGLEITDFNAKLDYMFDGSVPSVGIGDGGNEIGMGNLASVVESTPSLVKKACVIKVDRLVITSVSNWGGYGLAAAISLRKKKNLLLSVKEEQELLKRTVNLGAVDGMSAKPEYKADGFTMEENSALYQRLHDFLASKGVK